MQYKKITENNITYHLINTDRFKSLSIVFYLTKEFEQRDIVFGNFVCNNLMYSSKKYNTKNKIASKGEDLFGAKVSGSFGLTGKCTTMSFSLDFVNPKYTESKYMDESLDFLYEVVFNPNVKNGEFNKQYFNIIKKDAISNYNAIRENPNLFSSIEYAKLMFKGTPTAYPNIPDIDSINSVSPSNVYEYYTHLFDGTFNIDVCIFGEVEESIIDKIKDKFGFIKSNNKRLEFTTHSIYSGKENTKIDSLKYNQSRLYMGYKFDKMTKHEFNHVLKVYNTILGTMNDSLLFNIVREENSLCYSIGSYVTKYNPSLTIYAGINKCNYEKTIELIKKCVDCMNNKEMVSRLFDDSKKTINTYLNTYYDDENSQINYYYTGNYEHNEDVEELRENINKVTIDEVIELNNKIHLDTIYFMKGEGL